MPPCPAITDHAVAEATARPAPEPTDYGPSIADHEVPSRRALQHWRQRRLYPAYNAATLACSRLRPVPTARRTGLVVATSSGDRQAARRMRAAFLEAGEAESQRPRRLEVLLAVSRFVSAGLAQDVAAMLRTRGPELCLPGDCGLAPLATASLFIDAGRADAMVVVAVDPRPADPATYEAVAVVIERPILGGPAMPVPPVTAMIAGTTASVPAIREYLSHATASPDTSTAVPRAQCAVRWVGHAAAETDPDGWLDGGRRLLDQCLQVAGTNELGVVTASFADLSPDHALLAIERGAAPDEFAHEARRAMFEDGLRRHARGRGVRGPYVAVTGIPGASLLALALAEDLIGASATPTVAVLAGDWMGAGIARGLAALHCPEGPHLKSSVSAVILERARGQSGGRRIRSFVARRDACDEFGAEFRAHAPSHAAASGCTTEDLASARQFIAAACDGADRYYAARRNGRFLGADAVVCLADLLDLHGRTALSIRNNLGGSGLVLLDSAG